MSLNNNTNHENTKQNEKSTKDFMPVTIDTINVIGEIENVASSNNLNPNELTFRILQTTTLYRNHSSDEFDEISKENKDLFYDNDFLLNPNLELRQHFKIKIYKKYDKDIPSIILSGNKSLTKVLATIKKDKDIKYFPELEQDIIDIINAKKIHSNILIGFRDEEMRKEIKKIISTIRVKNFLESDATFTACQGLDRVSAVDDKFIYTYKNKLQSQDREGKIDYSKRGFISAVSVGEVIIEYIKPQSGIPGRNCQGRFLSVREPTSENWEEIKYTENIIKKEDDSRILFVANKNGYIEFENDIYDIKDQIEMKSIDFKSTGSIDTNLNSDVKISIKENNPLKDAIGSGMNVETSELYVQGSIAKGVTIKANIVEIEGQTHKTATIKADDIKISIHRGKAIGKNIDIGRLEGGFVNGENIKIKSIMGGEVIGKNIYIEELSSNSVIKASNSIELKSIKGSDNRLIIDSKVTQEYSEKTENISLEIKKITSLLQPLPKNLETKKIVLEKNRIVIDEIRQKIIELKKRAIKPPVSLLSKVKQYQKMVSEYNDLLKDFKSKKQKIKLLTDELKFIQNQIFSAKIVNHGVWKEYNEIKFKLISPPIEVTYNTKENEIIREITLNRIEDENFEIKRSSEYTK